MKEGRLTFVLQQPRVEIYINDADPTQLEAFASVLESIKEDRPVRQSMLRAAEAKAPTTDDWADRRSLWIKKVKEYPVSRAFPMHLVCLRAERLGLRRLDRRLMNLSALTQLMLGHNRLPDFNVDAGSVLAALHLTHLDLSSNRMTTWPVLPVSSPLHSSLQVLRLRGNPLRWLPASLWYLRELMELDLRNTEQLRQLPEGISAENRGLKTLLLGGSAVWWLPSSASHLRLTRLEMGDAEKKQIWTERIEGPVVSSLLALAAKTMLISGRGMTEPRPWTVNDYLLAMGRCFQCKGQNSFLAPDEAQVLTVNSMTFYCKAYGVLSSNCALQLDSQSCAYIAVRYCIPCAKKKRIIST